MTAYFDSSVLVAVYVAEVGSEAARRALSAESQAPCTPLHELEVRNAFRLLVGRKRITPREAVAVESHLDDDIAARRLVQVPIDLYEVFVRAEKLSARHSKQLLTRSLDILHVAAALELSCGRFVSFDARQVRLARAAGLNAINLSVPRRGTRTS
jgi:hypothetical protein